jgi:hypothetical protein
MPLIAKSNAGMPTLIDGKAVYGATPDVMRDHARRFRAFGATLIGGCCGNTPVHVAGMRAGLFDDAPMDPASVQLTVPVAERKAASSERRARRSG